MPHLMSQVLPRDLKPGDEIRRPYGSDPERVKLVVKRTRKTRGVIRAGHITRYKVITDWGGHSHFFVAPHVKIEVCMTHKRPEGS
jgi:hypothetical protein